MLKSILILAIISLTGVVKAQDLYFDAMFNGGAPINSGAWGTSSDLQIGPMKVLNDSMVIYATQTTQIGSPSYPMSLNVSSRTIHSDGSVTINGLYSGNTIAPNATYNRELITDILIGASGEVYVVKNEYDLNLEQQNVRLIKFNSFDPALGWTNSTTFGTNGQYLFNLNTDFRDAKGIVINGEPRIYGTYGETSTVNNLAAAYTVSQGAGFGFSVFTSNPQNTFSQVADVVRKADGTVIVADNYYSTMSTGSFAYLSENRLIALNIIGQVETTFATNGFVSTQWGSTLANVNTNIINMLFLDSSGDILVAGHELEYNSVNGLWDPRGKLSKYSASGTLVNSFGTSGTFDITSEPTFPRNSFYDVKELSNGKYIIASGGTYQVNGTNLGTKAFALQLSTSGVQDMVGTNGYLYYNDLFARFNYFHVQNSGKIVFLGVENLGQDELASFGRLSDNQGGGTNSLSSVKEDFISIYPNPSSSTINIEVKTPSKIKVLSSEGKTVATLSGASTYNFDASKLENGIYFIQAENGAVQKFIKH